MEKIIYTEPDDYLPKEIREKYFGKDKTDQTDMAKETAAEKTAQEESNADGQIE